MTPRNVILEGDALTLLRTLATDSVDSVVSSPPYYLGRDYRFVEALGLETTVDEWVRRLRVVMAEVARVLTPTGSAWLVLGDAYSRAARTGAPSKSLYLAPERLALALIEDGWTIRNRVIHNKLNPMPQSVEDRLATTSDVVLFLTRSPRYHFDLDAIREPYTGPREGLPGDAHDPLVSGNPGDVWRLPVAHYRGSHTSTFPRSLIRRPLLASCPAKVCTACGVPWKTNPGRTYVLGKRIPAEQSDRFVKRYPTRWRVVRQPGPIEATCDCDAPSRRGLVLDMYMGTGSTAVEARELGRDFLGIEIDPETATLAWQRLGRDPTTESRAA